MTIDKLRVIIEKAKGTEVFDAASNPKDKKKRSR
jgi:hypothetical protein